MSTTKKKSTSTKKKSTSTKAKSVDPIIAKIEEPVIDQVNVVEKPKTASAKPKIAKIDTHENDDLFIETIGNDVSILSICWKYFGNYDNLSKILADNNLSGIVQP